MTSYPVFHPLPGCDQTEVITTPINTTKLWPHSIFFFLKLASCVVSRWFTGAALLSFHHKNCVLNHPCSQCSATHGFLSAETYYYYDYNFPRFWLISKMEKNENIYYRNKSAKGKRTFDSLLKTGKNQMKNLVSSLLCSMLYLVWTVWRVLSVIDRGAAATGHWARCRETVWRED